MNKKIKILLVLLTYIGLILINTKAYAYTGKMINDTTRLRKEASTSSDILALVSLGEEVEIISEEGDWYKVTYKGKTGYIRKDMVSTSETVNNTQTDLSNENTSTENATTTENTSVEVSVQTPTQDATTIQIGYQSKLTSNLEIKIVPSINSSIIATISSNTTFEVKDVMNKWCYIETENASGWTLISKVNYDKTTVVSDTNSQNNTTSEENVETEESKTESEIQENKETKNQTETTQTEENSSTTKIKYVSTTTLNLREKPENDAKIITGLKQNTEVTVIEEPDSTWSKVTVNGKTGYVASKYLSDKKVTTTTRGESETRTSNTTTTTQNTTEEATSNSTSTSENTNKTETASSSNNSNSNTSSTSGTTGASIVVYAKQFLGNPYVYGGTSLTNGCDCSGFVMSVYAHFGYSLPHSSTSLRTVGTEVDKSSLQPGDIVCFSGHVGIYIGSNTFIHAANPSKGIITTSLSDSYYSAKYICARRVIN